jgi:anti-anti-sigma factor
MPQASAVISSPPTRHPAWRPPAFDCSWQAGGFGAAWVHVEGEVDLATSPQLLRTLGEAQREARLVVLDVREVTFIDSAGVHAILAAAATARREGQRLMLVRGHAHSTACSR